MKQIKHSDSGRGNLRTDCQLCWVTQNSKKGRLFFFFFLTSLYQVYFLGHTRLEQCRLHKAQSKLTLAIFQKCWKLTNLNHFQLQILFVLLPLALCHRIWVKTTEKHVVTDFTPFWALSLVYIGRMYYDQCHCSQRVIYGKEIIKSQTTAETRLCWHSLKESYA